MNVLCVNVGSSSLKMSLIGSDGSTLASRQIERWESGATEPIEDFLAGLGGVDAAAHRVVHGGDQYTTATIIDDDVVSGISALSRLAPLHQPRALAAILATRSVMRGAPEVACFDTAFHAGLPEAARTYALPLEWRNRWPIRRYGFHGLSHRYAFDRAGEITATDLTTRRVVTCHLGSGASLCAISGGRSVDTTMGFTPVEGLVMGTRSGSVDPGLVLWLIQAAGLSPEAVSEGLEHRSGLAGLADGSADIRDVLRGVGDSDPSCRLALDVYLHRLAAGVAAMAAALQGLDVLVFTGGVGEHSAEVRKATADRLGYLGVAISDRSNESAGEDVEISESRAPVRTLVVTSREDLEMARQARQVLGV